MKKLIYAISFILLIISLSTLSYGQGCVAIRPGGVCSLGGGNYNNNGLLQKGQWQVAATYRYFQSYKHYKGDVEQTERVTNGTQVINISNSIDFNLTYALNNRLSFSLNLPLISYDRSSLYEHYGNSITANPNQNRFNTGAKGIGDIRLSASYWLFDPEKAMNGNIAIGIGIKAPSGNYNVKDEFHSRLKDGKDSITIRPVDQSIQLGDGGWGISLEVQAFQKLFNRASLYFNGFYLSNPKNVNSTLTRGTLQGADPLIAYHSVADQFALRLGINYQPFASKNLFISLGGRLEGIPSHDLIGKSEGFRRPGYIISIEPSVMYMQGKTSFVLSVPTALYRNRTKSVYDLADPKGERHGDAAFADYLINASIIHRF
ncbi:MAG: hypothetical protein EAZ08_02165 [Cytophagales bacterium]|nr:MAG: hypothetical protein EAZ08_02165 [Cytophagales bacterium]